MKPKISVIMGVHNQHDYVRQSISSILNQTFTNFEFIIIDDASTDATSGIIKKFTDPKIKFITNSLRQGLAQSLNLAIRGSRGEFIARMDADDLSHPNRLKVQFEFLKFHPDIAVCGTAANLINISGKKMGQKHYPQIITPLVLMRYNPIIHPSVMIRKSTLPSPPYNPSFNGAEDYDLWLRLAVDHQLVNLGQTLLDYRVNPQGISWSSLKHTQLQAIKARLKALAQYHYPQWQSIFLIKPILSYLIPVRIKKLLFNIK